MKPAPPAAAPVSVVSRLRSTAIFRDYQQAFENTTGLPLALRQAGSFQSPLHGSARLNPFCALMAGRNPSCASCLQLQQEVEVRAGLQPATLECFAGLSESAVPVRVGDRLLGFLQTGQVFLRPPGRAHFRRLLRSLGGRVTGADRAALAAAYFKTRVITRSQYDSVIRLLAIFAEHLAVVSNQLLLRETTAMLPAIAKVCAYLAEHQGEVLNLRDTARTANMSKYYFCKLFKKTTGFTFTHYLSRLRVETAKQMLLNLHVRVSEAAYAVGFQSLSQFNRAFHRVAGESPSAFRERSHPGSPPLVLLRGGRGCAGTPAGHVASPRRQWVV